MASHKTILHGPSFSAERPQVKKSRQTLTREKNFVRQQYQKLEAQTTPKDFISDTFKGVCVYFSGYTDTKLSVWHLKQLVQAHQGRVMYSLFIKTTLTPQSVFRCQECVPCSDNGIIWIQN